MSILSTVVKTLAVAAAGKYVADRIKKDTDVPRAVNEKDSDSAWNDTEAQSVSEALEKLKESMQGLVDSTNELTDELTDLFQAAEKNGGKIPDVNEIMRQVLEESDNKQNTEQFR